MTVILMDGSFEITPVWKKIKPLYSAMRVLILLMLLNLRYRDLMRI